MILKRALATASLALLFDVAAVGQKAQPVIKRFDTEQFVVSVLAAARVSGSIQYSGKCRPGPSVFIPALPPIREPQRPYPPNPADTLRTMFSIDSGIVVSQESDGIIRVVETGVQTDILGVWIAHLSFDRISDPEYALNVVLRAPEVQSFIQAHGIGQPFRPVPIYALLPGAPNTSPRPGVRSISGELNDVTLADALDYLLKTFPGFWLYQDCEILDHQRVVYFGLFPVPGIMWSWDGTTLEQ